MQHARIACLDMNLMKVRMMMGVPVRGTVGRGSCMVMGRGEWGVAGNSGRVCPLTPLLACRVTESTFCECRFCY